MIAVEDEPERQCDSVAEIARKPRAIITDRLKTLSRVIRSPRRQRSGLLGRRGPEQFEFFAGWLRDLIPDDHILVRVDLVLDLSGPTVRRTRMFSALRSRHLTWSPFHQAP
jgi:hypothetical protein